MNATVLILIIFLEFHELFGIQRQILEDGLNTHDRLLSV